MFRPRSLIITTILCGIGLAHSAASEISAVRISATDASTRVVLDLDGPRAHRLFSLSNPSRVVVDVSATRVIQSALPLPEGKGVVDRIRTGPRERGATRVVLDVDSPVRPRSFLLRPNESYGHRLVIDLLPSTTATKSPAKTARAANRSVRDLVIAIDAGHGGKDPGARGPAGNLEKRVVLDVAKQLAVLIDEEAGMRAVLIRDGDYFMQHRARINKARQNSADMFISIHADAFKDARAKGASVFVLSEHGATSEAARWLAEKENAAGLVGGVSLDDKDDVLASVLFDLSQTATISASLNAAKKVLREIGKINTLHSKRVKQAGFLVLKSPDIPSVFVEAAFISNPTEERRLADSSHQAKLATAILAGVREYFYQSAPPGTVVAENHKKGGRPDVVRHVIRRGDTLSEIAARYNVSLTRLRAANGIRGDRIRIGQVLQIPVIAGI